MQSKNKFFITIIFLLILIYGCKTTNSDTTDTSKNQSYSQAKYFNMAGNTAKEKKTEQELYTIIQKLLKQILIILKPI